MRLVGPLFISHCTRWLVKCIIWATAVHHHVLLSLQHLLLSLLPQLHGIIDFKHFHVKLGYLVEIFGTDPPNPEERTHLVGLQHLLEATLVHGLSTDLLVSTRQKVAQGLVQVREDLVVAQLQAVRDQLKKTKAAALHRSL